VVRALFAEVKRFIGPRFADSWVFRNTNLICLQLQQDSSDFYERFVLGSRFEWGQAEGDCGGYGCEWIGVQDYMILTSE